MSEEWMLMPRGNVMQGRELIETYAYYDQPVLFTAWNKVLGRAELIVLIDADDDAHTETWLTVSMSQERHESLKSGSIDFHDTFTLSENGACKKETYHYKEDGIGDSITVVIAKSLTIDDLPLPGEFATN